MKLINWFKRLFTDDKGIPSSKRFVGIVGALLLFVTMFVNSFTHQDVAPSGSLVDAVLILSLGALGLTSADKFAKNKEK